MMWVFFNLSCRHWSRRQSAEPAGRAILSEARPLASRSSSPRQSQTLANSPSPRPGSGESCPEQIPQTCNNHEKQIVSLILSESINATKSEINAFEFRVFLQWCGQTLFHISQGQYPFSVCTFMDARFSFLANAYSANAFCGAHMDPQQILNEKK